MSPLPELPRDRTDPLVPPGVGDGRGPGVAGVARGVSAPPSRRGGLTLAVTVATAALLLATESRLSIVWDEGYTLGREARLRDWFRALADPARFAAGWRPPGVELVQQDGTPPPRPERIDTRAKL